MPRRRVDEATFSKASVVTIPSLDGYLKPVTVYGKSTQGGTPTPDVPVPIVSTTGNVTVVSATKNIFDGQLELGGMNTTTGATAAASDRVRSTNFISVAPSKTYKVSLDGLAKTVTYLAYDLNKNYLNINSTLDQFTTSSQTAYIKFVFVAGFSVTAPIQIELGTTITPYTNGFVSEKTLPLATTQLRSLPNGVSDRIYKDGSTWKLEQNVGTVTYSGTEAWAYESGLATVYRFTLTGQPQLTTVNNSTRVQTNLFATVTQSYTSDTLSYYSSSGTIVFKPLMATIDAVAGASIIAKWKAYLGINNLVFNHELAAPVTTAITDPTLITALENIRTYQGVTNITASTPISGVYLPNSLRTAATNRLTAVGRQIATNRVKVN